MQWQAPVLWCYGTNLRTFSLKLKMKRRNSNEFLSGLKMDVYGVQTTEWWKVAGEDLYSASIIWRSRRERSLTRFKISFEQNSQTWWIFSRLLKTKCSLWLWMWMELVEGFLNSSIDQITAKTIVNYAKTIAENQNTAAPTISCFGN